MLALTCLLMVSCGNMGQVMSAMTNGTGIANAVKSVIGLDKLKTQQLIGDWKYKGPGCAFTSENLLAKAGGEIAAVQIEEKVQPYYQQVGITPPSASKKTVPSLLKLSAPHSTANILSTKRLRRLH